MTSIKTHTTFYRSILVSVITIFMTLVASAHDTWLVPKTFSIRPGTRLSLDLTSGMLFPVLETSINPDRIETARVRINGMADDINNRISRKNSLSLTLQLNEEGTATCWVDLKPRLLELTPNLVEEYFSEINASPGIREAWQNMKTPKRWREIYVKHAKTFIKVGQNSTDKDWSEPVGMTLEIVPLANPTTLKVGDEFGVRVLKNGNPFPNFPLSVVLGGQSQGTFRTTDSEGSAVFHLARAGRYLLRGTDLRRSSKADIEWESDFTTLTIEVH
jgi:uncharacterized GH25 family protein